MYDLYFAGHECRSGLIVPPQVVHFRCMFPDLINDWVKCDGVIGVGALLIKIHQDILNVLNKYLPFGLLMQ